MARSFLFVAGLLLLLLAGCDTTEPPSTECTSATATFSGPTATVRFLFINVVHPIDVWVDGECALENADPYVATEYIALPAGTTVPTFTISFLENGLQEPLTLEAGQTYTVVLLYGLHAVVLPDNVAPEGQAVVRAVIGEGGYRTHTLQIETREQASDPPTIVESEVVPFGEASSPMLLDPRTYTVRIRSENTGAAAVDYAVQLAAQAGWTYTYVSNANTQPILVTAPPPGSGSK